MDESTITADDLEKKSAEFLRVMTALESQFNEKFERLEGRFENFEKQLAVITQAYAELAAIVESLFSVYINRDEEQTKEFFEVLGTARKTMIETLQHGVKVAEINADRFVAHSAGTDEQPASDTSPNE